MAFPLGFLIPLFRISLEVYATASPAAASIARTGHTQEEPWGGKGADVATLFHGSGDNAVKCPSLTDELWC